MRLASLAVPLALVAAAACTKDNPDYCGSDPCPIDAPLPIDGQSGCTATPSLCTAEQSCLDDVCVDCEIDNNHQQADCTLAAAPVCATGHTCRACAADSECDSNVCDGGACVPATEVAYVTPTGTATTGCTQAAPCSTMAQAIATPKAVISVAAGSYSSGNAEIDFNNRAATVHATGATFSRTMMGSVMTVRGNSDVTFLGGTFDGNGDGAGSTIITTTAGTTLTLVGVVVKNSEKDGIAADGTLTIRKSTIGPNAAVGAASNNITKPLEVTQSTFIRNGTTGLKITASTATVMNNFILKNGANGAFPALRVEGLGLPGSSRLEFNTIAGNIADAATIGGGALCLAATSVLRNTIVYGNAGTGQVSGCTMRFSDVQGATPDVANGIFDAAPMFADTPSDNFRLMPGSPAAGKADPTSTLTGTAAVDIDGEARPRPAATPADVGADEIP